MKSAAAISTPPAAWQCGRFSFAADSPVVMGIVNVTPDSFSDGGQFLKPKDAITHALQLAEAGADVVDIGGESTRPGAAAVTAKDEMRRVLPVIEKLAARDVCVSADTRHPQTMRAAVQAGASIINDIGGFQLAKAAEAVADSNCGAVVMHMQGAPQTMQNAPHYDDVCGEVFGFLRAQAQMLMARGVAPARIALDPGFGFGKTLDHNTALMRGLPQLAEFGFAVLVGTSRKSIIGGITGRAADSRLAGDVAAAVCARQRGARIFRVHDVAETIDALKIARAFL